MFLVKCKKNKAQSFLKKIKTLKLNNRWNIYILPNIWNFRIWVILKKTNYFLQFINNPFEWSFCKKAGLKFIKNKTVKNVKKIPVCVPFYVKIGFTISFPLCYFFQTGSFTIDIDFLNLIKTITYITVCLQWFTILCQFSFAH